MYQTILNLRETKKEVRMQSICSHKANIVTFRRSPSKLRSRTSAIRPIRLNCCTLPREGEKFNYTSIILRVEHCPFYITNSLLSIFV